jgi:predicted HicB family RNase H-like nuclease
MKKDYYHKMTISIPKYLHLKLKATAKLQNKTLSKLIAEQYEEKAN